MDRYVNGHLITQSRFAFDGCHKIYLIDDDGNDLEEAKGYGYEILPIDQLIEVFNKSCDLKFIDNWKLTKQYVRQGEYANFTTRA